MDVLELPVSMRIGVARELLVIDAQRELQSLEQSSNRLGGCLDPDPAKRLADFQRSLVGPLEPRNRVARGMVFHQLLDRSDGFRRFFSSA